MPTTTTTIKALCCAFVLLAPIAAQAEEKPAAAPAPETATQTENAAPGEAASETASSLAEAEAETKRGDGVLCIPKLGDDVEVRFNGSAPMSTTKGITLGGLSEYRKSQLTVYAAGEYVQSFTVQLSSYSRPYMRMRPKEGSAGAWVLRTMRSRHCPFPTPEVAATN